MQVYIIEKASTPTVGVMVCPILIAMGHTGYGLLALLGGYAVYLIAIRTTGE
jgi:hypothetical protein